MDGRTDRRWCYVVGEISIVIYAYLESISGAEEELKMGKLQFWNISNDIFHYWTEGICFGVQIT